MAREETHTQGRPAGRGTALRSPGRCMPLTTAVLGGLILFAGPAPGVLADELVMEPIRAGDDLRTPRRGTTMDRVASAWGQPADRQAAVGDPPITRWEYDRFVVYFEYQYVLHTVVKPPQR